MEEEGGEIKERLSTMPLFCFLIGLKIRAECGRIMKKLSLMESEYSAGGVVYRRWHNKVQILFILDPYGEWAFPKGHIEKEESNQEAAWREIEEETGLAKSGLRVVEYLGELEYQFTFTNRKIHKLVHFYLFEAAPEAQATPQPGEKITAVKWVDIDKAVEFSSYKNVGRILKKGITYIQNADN